MRLDIELSEKEYSLLSIALDEAIFREESRLDDAVAEGKTAKAEQLQEDVANLRGVLDKITEAHYKE